MVTIDGVNFYKPKEIAENKLIVNYNGNSSYTYVLRLIREGKLEAKVWNNEGSLTPYYIVSETEIERFNSRFTSKATSTNSED